MPLASVDFTSWYAFLAYAAAAYILWRTFLGQLSRDARAVRQRVKPDPATTKARIDLQVRKTGKMQYVLDITNAGDVPVDQVEVGLPSEAYNWQLLTEALTAYPIRVLEPGDTVSVPLAISMGQHASVEAVVRGRVDGEEYKRLRTLSAVGR